MKVSEVRLNSCLLWPFMFKKCVPGPCRQVCVREEIKYFRRAKTDASQRNIHPHTCVADDING